MKMMLRRFGFAVLVVVGVSALALPALAGGWTVTTLDLLPDYAIAGEPLNVGFMIGQHGQRPWMQDGIVVRAGRDDGGESFSVTALPEGEGGHYTATLIFPQSGTWNWSIESGLRPEQQPMPPLTVLDSAPADSPAPVPAASPALPMTIGVIGLMGGVIGLIALARTRAAWAAALVLIAVMVGGVGFVLAANQEESPPPAVSISTPSQIELGQKLFIAKGCVVCHRHDAVAEVKRQIDFNFDEAPNLTKFSADPDYLAKWLDDPAAVKPETYMPKLNLSDDEVGALVAFMNAP